MSGLMFMAYQQALDGNGNPYPGAKLYFYAAGTTTPQDTYTDYTLATPNANPVVADSAGRFGAIYYGAALYKAVLKTSAGATVWTADYVGGNVVDVLTTRGDLLTRDATGYKRLAKGTNGQALLSNGTDPVWGAIPALASANVWTADQTIRSTDASATYGPSLNLDRNSASPAASDAIGALWATGRDTVAAVTTYAGLQAYIVDPTNGSEDGRWDIGTMVAGTYATRFSVGYGLYANGLTDPGDGIVNAKGFQVNGVAFPVSKTYTSAQQTITSAGSLSLSHGLGAVPKLVFVTAVCQSAEYGYSVNDVIYLGSVTPWSDSGYGLALRLTSSTIDVRFGSDANPMRYANFTTGAGVQLTNAKWKLVFSAYA